MAFPTTGLVSYWKLDEASGNATDSKGSNTLTNVGTTTYSTGKISNAAQFLRSSKYLESSTTTGLAPTTAFSINAWVKWDSLTDNALNGLISKMNGTSTAYRTGIVRYSSINYAFFFDIGTTGGSTNRSQSVIMTAPNNGQWYMYTYTFNGPTAKMYIDGTLFFTDNAAPATCQAGTAPFRLGYGDSADGTGPEGMNGMLDEVGFWNTELSQSDVTALYNAGAGLTYATAGGGTISTNKTTQEYLNIKAGTSGLTKQEAINRLAGTSGLTQQEAWNVYAGLTPKTGQTEQQAANVKVSKTGLSVQQASSII